MIVMMEPKEKKNTEKGVRELSLLMQREPKLLQNTFYFMLLRKSRGAPGWHRG